MNLFLDPSNIRDGFTIVPNFIFSLDIPSHEKLFLIALLSYAHQKAGCFPGREKLSKDTSLSKRTLVKTAKSLNQKGFKMKRRGKKKTNYYNSPLFAAFYAPPQKDRQKEADTNTPAPMVKEAITNQAENIFPDLDLGFDLEIKSQQILPAIEPVNLVIEEPMKCEPCTSLESAQIALHENNKHAKKQEHTHARASARRRTRKRARPRVSSPSVNKSQFTEAQCIEYAASLRKQGIINPIGYGKTIHRSGADDDKIAAYFAVRKLEQVEKEAKQMNQAIQLPVQSGGYNKNCPHCFGIGARYVSDYKFSQAAAVMTACDCNQIGDQTNNVIDMAEQNFGSGGYIKTVTEMGAIDLPLDPNGASNNVYSDSRADNNRPPQNARLGEKDTGHPIINFMLTERREHKVELSDAPDNT